MSENDQPNQQQREENDKNEQQTDPKDQTKQAPGFNEDPANRGQSEGGETNQQDPAWRPSDDPAVTTAKPLGNHDIADSHSQSRSAGGER